MSSTLCFSLPINFPVQSGQEVEPGQCEGRHLPTRRGFSTRSTGIGKPEVKLNLTAPIGRQPQGIVFPAIFGNGSGITGRWGKIPAELSQILARPDFARLTVSPAEPCIVRATAISGK